MKFTEINLFGVADHLPRYPTDQRPKPSRQQGQNMAAG